MKAGHLENHLRARHFDHVKSNLELFKSLKIKFVNMTKITSLIAIKTVFLNCTLEASHKIFRLIA